MESSDGHTAYGILLLFWVSSALWAAGLDWRTVAPTGEAYPDFSFPHDPANIQQGARDAIDFACFA